MATNAVQDTNSELVNWNFLKCPVCKRTYNSPKVLPCLHSFCFDCLHKSLKQSKIGKGQSFLCPICQFECIVPTRGVPGMKTNIFLITLQEFHHRKTLDPGQVCDVCEDQDGNKSARNICIECGDWLCTQCCSVHNHVKLTKNHTLVTPEDLKTGQFDEMLKQSFESLMCNKHDEPLKLYCTAPSCMAPICTVCKSTLGHDGHRAIALEDKACQEAQTMKRLVPNVQHSIVSCQNRMYNLRQSEKNLGMVRKKCHKQITKRMEEVVDIMVKRLSVYCEELHGQVETMAKEHKKVLKKELDITEKKLCQMVSAKEFADHLIDFNRPEELVSMSREVIDRLVEFQKIPHTGIPGWRQPRLHPPQEANSDLVHQLFGSLTFEGEVVKTVLLRSFNAKIEDDTKDCALCDVSLDSEGNLIVVDRDNKKVKVFDRNGNLKLSTGAWILKNPNRVAFMKKSHRILVKDDKLLRILKSDGTFERHIFADLKQPVGITQTSQGEVLVTDWMEGTVFSFDESGKLMRSFSCACEAPGYICSSVTGNIVVSDWKQHCVKIFDCRGKLLWSYGRHGTGCAELDHPYGICCDEYGHIIVADTWNNRIHLLSEEGKFLSILLDSEDGIIWPQAVITDKNGNLIVAEQCGNIKTFQYIA